MTGTQLAYALAIGLVVLGVGIAVYLLFLESVSSNEEDIFK